MMWGYPPILGNLHTVDDKFLRLLSPFQFLVRMTTCCKMVRVIWRFPEIGVPPIIIHLIFGFSIMNHPASYRGIPPFFRKTLICFKCQNSRLDFHQSRYSPQKMELTELMEKFRLRRQECFAVHIPLSSQVSLIGPIRISQQHRICHRQQVTVRCL